MCEQLVKGMRVNMHIKKSKGEIAFTVFNTVFMIVMMFVMAFPLWHVVMSSLSDSGELIRNTGKLLFKPIGFNLESYKLVFKNPNIISGYKVTLFVVLVGTLASVFMTTLGAYGLSRKNLMFGRLFSKMIIFTMLFSGGMIPGYIVVNNVLHLGDKLAVLILPGMISTWNLMVMRTSLAAIPESLIESAQLDGANDFVVLFKIVIPTSMAIIAVMILFYGVSYWNSWFGAMLYIRDREKYPLQLVLREILLSNNTESMMSGRAIDDKSAVSESLKYATIVISTLPILCVYPFLQKYFVKGVLIGSVKG